MRRVAGFVIVSSDGMIADAKGKMPETLHNDADQKFFQAELDRAAVVVHGRHSHEGGPRAAQRKRIVLTRRNIALAPDSLHPHSLLWNPALAPLERALELLGVADGSIAIIGGTDVFSMFLPLYDAFHLSRAAHATIPGGRPVFSEVGPGTTPEDVLTRHGLRPGPRRELDPAAGVTIATWQR
ncbi:MAG: dihydrofolate reductase [Xanthobacteraceae bacterium]